MVRCAPSLRVPTSMTVVTGYWLSNWNSHPTRTRIVVDSPQEGERGPSIDPRSRLGRSMRARHLLAELRAPPYNRMGRRRIAVNDYLHHVHLLMNILKFSANDGRY